MNEENQIERWYQSNIDQYQKLLNQQQGKSNLLSNLRLGVFVFFITLSGISIYFESWDWLAASLVLWGICFGLLINRHNAVKARITHYDLLSSINQQELKKLSLELHQFADGRVYINSEHPYCVDLDLFGPHSLFQWINRTVTKGGEELLASNFLNASPVEELKKRQAAIQELASKATWSQNLLASGMAFKRNDQGINDFLDWVRIPITLPSWSHTAPLILPVVAIGLSIAYLSGLMAGYWALCALIINGYVLSKVQDLAKHTYDQTHRSIQTLQSYEAMIAQIEDSEFENSLLMELKVPFIDKQERASHTIRQLKELLSRIEVRHNGFYWIINPFLLLDIIYLKQARNWKLRHGDHVLKWFEALNYYEMLVSIGLTARSQPDFTYPVLVDQHFHLEVKGIGHPLIRTDERVCNDFSITNEGTVVVLTGSNMSGKSTFLRTIGINVVLARLGAPVCADKMQVGEFQMFSSMRTTDSLEQHVSSFYAELERINQLIRLLEQGKPTFFLLDELLKGTNSHDRNLGSTALIRQLGKSSAFGLVSTHDLALGSLADSYDNVKNYSFNSQMMEGRINFDYILQPGICNSFNAAELMAQMGIDLKYHQRND